MGGTVREYVNRCTKASIPKEVIKEHLQLLGNFRNMDIDWDKMALPPTPEQMMAQQQAMMQTMHAFGMPVPTVPAVRAPPAAKSRAPALAGGPLQVDQEALEARKRRFQAQPPLKKQRVEATPGASNGLDNFGAMEPVVGLCETLEKQYLRLTSAPDPRLVRPKRVLKKAFAHVIGRYENGKDYSYIVSQLKSIRQDMKVQNIEDGFTIQVYEANARIAMLNKDMGEYNQCLSQLNELYQKPSLAFSLATSSGEFIAYAIYYSLYTQANKDLDKTVYLVRSDKRLVDSEPLAFALQVIEALYTGSSLQLFEMFSRAEHLRQIALEPVVRRERLRVMVQMLSGVKGGLSVERVQHLLRFESYDTAQEFVQTVTRHVVDGELDVAKAKGDFERVLGGETKVDIKGQK